MKRSLRISAAALLLSCCLIFQQQSFAQYYPDDNGYQDRDISYQTFYDELSPHGQWVEYPDHGYVWVPDVEEDFQPYSTNGHWVYNDDYEWVWVSDYDWGWAPFHYGRWDHDDYYGWYWVPGYEWAPAWVAWRDGGDYYGWAPLRPGISININIGGYNPPNRFWCFTPRRYITHQRWYDYRVDWRQNVTIINNTTIINYNGYRSGSGFRCGPRRYEAERYCGRINPVRFRDSYSPGRTFYRNNEVSFYRPRVREDYNRQIAPRSFERYDRNNNGGSFRNRNNGNNGFRREMNTGREGGNIRRPDERDRMQHPNNGGGFRRSDDNNRNDQEPYNRERFNRQQGPGVVPGSRPDERRVYRPAEPREQPGNNGNRFERRSIDRDNGNGPNREFRGGENRPAPQRVERRYEAPPQQQPQRMERRYEQPQRMERRYEQPSAERRPMQQPSSRQVERRTEERPQGSGGNGGGGRGRFSRN